MKVLMIDDTRTVHMLVKSLLAKSTGIEVTSAMNGEEGWTKLKADRDYDLILLDWEMPILNGVETLVKIRSEGFQTPIIMMTTKNEPEDIKKALELGASEYLMKPFTIDILFEKIGSVLGREVTYVA